MSILDSDKRLADHFSGKLHIGYAQLRQTIEGFERDGGPVPLKYRKGASAAKQAEPEAKKPTAEEIAQQLQENPLQAPAAYSGEADFKKQLEREREERRNKHGAF